MDGNTDAVIAHLMQDQPEGIVGTDVIDYDDTTGDLDLRVVVADGPCEETFPARLKLEAGRLVPEDPSDRITLELHRTRWD